MLLSILSGFLFSQTDLALLHEWCLTNLYQIGIIRLYYSNTLTTEHEDGEKKIEIFSERSKYYLDSFYHFTRKLFKKHFINFKRNQNYFELERADIKIKYYKRKQLKKAFQNKRNKNLKGLE